MPGKLSDLAWMMFAPPVLAYILSFATLGKVQGQRAAFAAAYAGLPLLYAAFNTFQPLHDAILRVLGFIGGDGPRSPLDPTDSLVIPLAMVAALWVWSRPPLAESIRARFALLATVAAALASVATSYVTDRGVVNVGRTPSGALGAYISADYPASIGTYESMDSGLTWTKTSEDFVPLEGQEWSELEVKEPSGAVFIVDSPHIIREWGELEGEEPSGVFLASDGRITAYGPSSSREVVYSYEYLQSGGNRWMQALDKRDVENRVIATWPLELFYDDQSGNLIVAMGLQGVVVIAPDGTTTRVTVGRYSPTDFSFGSKTRTFFSSLVLRETAVSTGLAVLLAFSFAALALAASATSERAGLARISLALAAAISTLLAISVGVYPRVFESPWEDSSSWRVVGGLALVVSGFGLVPLLIAIGGLALARSSRRQVLAVAAASIGMLPVIVLGSVVLFETGTGIANFVAVGLVGLAAFGLWAYRKRTQRG